MAGDTPSRASPRALAPLFSLLAVFHVAAVITRFDVVAGHVPAAVASGILLAHFPILLVAGWFESRIDYGGDPDSTMPLWMRIDSKPVKLAFTFAFTYLGIVVLQAWDVEIGPIDPSPPAEWPLQQRAMWFGIMTGGMFFPNYLATAGLLIPALRGIAKPLHRVPSLVALVLLSVVGTGIGFGAVLLLANQALSGGIAEVQSFVDSDPAIAIGVALGLVWIPILWGLLTGRGD